MKKIVILNSYTLTSQTPMHLVRIQEFLSGLKSKKYKAGKDIDVEVIDSNSLEELEKKLQKIPGKIDLIHAIGTPNAILAGRFSEDIPVVYYGAHPEGVGIEDCNKKNIKGFILRLPFTANYKNFRFIRKLLPSVKNLYVPFYKNTPFCTNSMEEKHRVFRNSEKNKIWVQMDSEFIAYTTLSKLCYIIGLNYYETVYNDIEDLKHSLDLINPKESLIMPYNDNVYCENAPGTIINAGLENNIPVLWNNNPEATQIGALVAIAGCFREAGFKTGQMAGELLNGNRDINNEIQHSNKAYSSINLNVAKRLGLQFSNSILEYFDEIIHELHYNRSTSL